MKKPKQGKSVISRINGVIWMIGIFYLSYTGNWFPGILYLVAITAVINIVAPLLFAGLTSKDEYDPEDFSAPARADDLDGQERPLAPDPVGSPNNTRMQRLDPDPIPPLHPLSREYRTDLLPPKCPNCGAPISEKDVEMVGIKTAKCGFCGSHFSLTE
ncbi:MAG: hypothetical protein V2J07_01715 [Anaerolineae bacterium]|nr:hypothetical protein [Anaerolineae bacterium]